MSVARRVSEPVTIELDLKIDIDDVPIGLSLMSCTPFRFSCHKLWFKAIPDITIPYSNISHFINPKVRT